MVKGKKKIELSCGTIVELTEEYVSLVFGASEYMPITKVHIERETIIRVAIELLKEGL